MTNCWNDLFHKTFTGCSFSNIKDLQPFFPQFLSLHLGRFVGHNKTFRSSLFYNYFSHLKTNQCMDWLKKKSLKCEENGCFVTDPRKLFCTSNRTIILYIYSRLMRLLINSNHKMFAPCWVFRFTKLIFHPEKILPSHSNFHHFQSPPYWLPLAVHRWVWWQLCQWYHTMFQHTTHSSQKIKNTSADNCYSHYWFIWHSPFFNQLVF